MTIGQVLIRLVRTLQTLLALERDDAKAARLMREAITRVIGAAFGAGQCYLSPGEFAITISCDSRREDLARERIYVEIVPLAVLGRDLICQELAGLYMVATLIGGRLIAGSGLTPLDASIDLARAIEEAEEGTPPAPPIMVATYLDSEIATPSELGYLGRTDLGGGNG